MKLIYLLPPSEGKNPGGEIGTESLSCDFKKPLEIAANATEKDLKCKGIRYEEGIELNKKMQLALSPSGGKLDRGMMAAISRYSGVMYNAINYSGMSQTGKKYFEENFKILSGMYGLVNPLDSIGNYKLPIETKGLYAFWWDSITKTLDSFEADYIIDMLPGSYAKMIDWKALRVPVVQINFLHHKDGQLKKISHGVKKIKGEYIYELCNNSPKEIEEFSGNIEKISENNYIISVISI